MLAVSESRAAILDLNKAGDGFSSVSPIPAILHTCRLSREVGLKTYKVSFGNKNSPARTYFNFAKDALYLPRSTTKAFITTSKSLMEPAERSQLSSLAIALDDELNEDVIRKLFRYENGCDTYNWFENVKEAFLVLETPRLSVELEFRFSALQKGDLWVLARDAVRILRLDKRYSTRWALDDLKSMLEVHTHRTEHVMVALVKGENW